MDFHLHGRRAVVVGASKGLGRAVAKLLAAEGCAVAAVARTASLLGSLIDELPGAGHLTCATDLLVDGAPTRLAAELLEAFVPDIVVHNVGGSLGVTDSLATAGDYARVWRVNVGIPIELNRLFAPGMSERGWGRIVHVSSVSAENFSGYSAYVSAKGALNAYVKTIGRALAPKGVIVSAVCPGPLFGEGRYLTRLQQDQSSGWREFCEHHLAIGRLARPEDIAPFVAMLCAPLASYAAGAIINIDGGSR